MILGVVLTLMTVAVLAALVWPLVKPPAGTTSRLDHDLAVYRDQLAELEREQARGALPASEAEAAKVEIGRRILAADAAAQKIQGAAPSSGKRHWGIAATVGGILVVAAFVTYGMLGAPNLPDQPLAARANDPDVRLTRLAEQLSATLATNPDPKGFSMLGGALDSLGRYDESTAAYRKAQSLGDDSAATYSLLGQAIAMAQGGGVVPEARTDFLKALQRDPTDARARFFVGLAEAQIGQAAKAIAIWRDLLKDSKPDSPWLPMVQDNLAKLGRETGTDPNTIPPDASDIGRQIKEMESHPSG